MIMQPRSVDFCAITRQSRDPLLAALVEPVLPTNPEQRLDLINDCLRVNPTCYRAFPGLPAIGRTGRAIPWAIVQI